MKETLFLDYNRIIYIKWEESMKYKLIFYFCASSLIASISIPIMLP